MNRGQAPPALDIKAIVVPEPVVGAKLPELGAITGGRRLACVNPTDHDGP